MVTDMVTDTIQPEKYESRGLDRMAQLLEELTKHYPPAARVIRELGDEIPAVAWVKSTRGEYEYANQAFCLCFNIDPVGRNDVDLWASDHTAAHEYNIGDVQAQLGPVVRTEPDPVSREVDWLVCKFPMFKNGIVVGVAGFAIPLGNAPLAQEMRSYIEKAISRER